MSHSETRSTEPVTWHWMLALTSLAAAAIHFAVMGDHFQHALLFGLFFSVVAWAQALWAVAMLVATGRRVILAGLVGNLAVVATWAFSRTSGLPVGPEPWTAEAVGAADIAATVLELVIVAGCGLLLANRLGGLLERVRGRVPVFALGLSLAILTSLAIGTSSDHSHSSSEASADHHTSEAGNDESGDHTHRLVGGSGEPDPAQIELIRSQMAKYDDVDVALTEGWEEGHPDWPGTGSHFYREDDWAGSFPARPEVDVTDPEFLMYSKLLSDTGEWQLVAMAYVVDKALYPEPPANLTGATYHEHVWNCILDGEELEEEDWGVLSMEECEVMGGEWSPGGVWMTHVWLVDNPDGIFAEENPDLV